MPHTAATSSPLRANLRVFRVHWPADPSQVERSFEPLRARLLSLGMTTRHERGLAAAALEGLVRAGERVLADIESLEATKARVEAELLAAYAALHTIEAQQIDALPGNAASADVGAGVTGAGRQRGDRAGDRCRRRRGRAPAVARHGAASAPADPRRVAVWRDHAATRSICGARVWHSRHGA